MRTLRILLFVLSSWTVPSMAVSVGGIEFAERINVPGVGNNLQLSGAAVLDRNFVPFYAGALYVPMSVRTADQLMSGLSPYRVTLVWMLPGLSKDRVADYWHNAFAVAAGKDLPRIKLQIDRFMAVFDNDVRHGQVVLFDYIPDSGMRIFIDDKPAGQLAGVEFNRVLLSIWLGDNAPGDFRRALLAGFAQK
jgi:hypothetical protein